MIEGFNTVNGKDCCNLQVIKATQATASGFNTVNGKYCCNVMTHAEAADNKDGFQYRIR